MYRKHKVRGVRCRGLEQWMKTKPAATNETKKGQKCTNLYQYLWVVGITTNIKLPWTISNDFIYIYILDCMFCAFVKLTAIIQNTSESFPTPWCINHPCQIVPKKKKKKKWINFTWTFGKQLKQHFELPLQKPMIHAQNLKPKKKKNNHIMDLCEIINCLEIIFFLTNFEHSF